MGPNFVLDKGFKLTGAVYPNIFNVVKFGAAADTVTGSTTAGEKCLGVVQEQVYGPTNPNSQGIDFIAQGRVVNVRILGISRVVATGVIALGAPVVSNGDGTVKAAPAATANQDQVGIAFAPAASTGDQIDVLLTPGARLTTP